MGDEDRGGDVSLEHVVEELRDVALACCWGRCAASAPCSSGRPHRELVGQAVDAEHRNDDAFAAGEDGLAQWGGAVVYMRRACLARS